MIYETIRLFLFLCQTIFGTNNVNTTQRTDHKFVGIIECTFSGKKRNHGIMDLSFTNNPLIVFENCRRN